LRFAGAKAEADPTNRRARWLAENFIVDFDVLIWSDNRYWGGDRIAGGKLSLMG